MNNYDLNGLTAVVTGAGRGIGRAITERLLASGANVMLWDINRAALEAAPAALGVGDRADTAIADVTDPDAVEAAHAATIERFGGIDILVNDAGVSGPTVTTWEYTLEDWNRVVNINLTGTFICCKAVVPGMMERGYGRIVNIASITGKVGSANAPAYSAAKAGVIALTKSLAKEAVDAGVLVNCVTPSAIHTQFLDQLSAAHLKHLLDTNDDIPLGRLGKPEEVAHLVAWLCSADCSFSTGAVFDLSGGRATY
jgi:NAD(P)-dependent dehydrogenase (short-subunit alcohol dehydrogenase family)